MNSDVIRVFIGYDRLETVAWNVLSHSIIEKSSMPVSITPVALDHLKLVFNRERNSLQSTEFSFSRFMTPYLANYEGWAVFMDNDMLMRDDIAKLWELRNDKYAVQVVKHDHVPKETKKFLDMPQSKYQKKNWSSVMLMNCSQCKTLTPEYVNSASGLELHQFKWLKNDDLIGELPHRWNHLVGYDEMNSDAALVHFTIGGPYFKEWGNCDYSKEWFEHRERMLFCEERPK